MLIDCELMGSERKFELPVPDVEQAWSFYRDIMGAQEVFRSEPGTGESTRIGFTIGNAGFMITSQGNAQVGDGRPTPALLAADFGAAFAAIVLYVQDPVSVVRRVLEAGGRFRPEATAGTPSYRGQPVELIVDPYGHSWAVAKSPDRRFN